MKHIVRLTGGILAAAYVLLAQQPVLRQYTVATMPAASANSGISIVVKDGSTATDCSVGSGSFAVVCKSNGTTWSAQSIGSGGSVPAAGVVKSNGTSLIDAAASDVVALFGSGSCSGYLKSDGTCNTPSSGNVSTTSLTTGAIVTASGATAIQTPNTSTTLDASGNVSTPGAVTAASYATNGAAPGNISLLSGTGSISALSANSAGFAAPATGGTSYLFKLPGTASAGLLFAASPATGDGVNESALSFKSLQGTDTNILTAGTVSGTGSSLCTSANGGATTSGCPSYLTGNQSITLSGDVTGSGTTAITTTAAKVNGTSVPTNSAADQAIVTTAAATGSWASLPACLDSGGQHLNYNTTTHTFSCGTTGGTAGSAAFNAITGGTNTQAAMLVGTGASIGPTGSGVVNANQINGGTVPASAAILASNSSNQPVSTTFSAVSPITTLGDILYGSAANTTSRLAGYTTANTAVLTQTGTGTVSASPAWSNAPALSAANMTSFPTLNQNTTGNAATATSATTATNIAGGAVGAVPYQTGSGATSLLSGNTAATDQVLVSHGTGTVAQAPTLSNAPALSAANMTSFPTLNQNTTGSAASFTGSLSGDVTGTQSATVVGKINGGSMPASATVLGSNSSSQPVAISISNNTVLGNNSGIIAAPIALTATNLDALLGTVPATSSTFGVVKVDGTTITASGGVISAVSGGSGNMALTSGAGAPSGSCTAGTSWYLDTTNQDDWFCSSTNIWKKNISTSNSGPFVATGQTSSSTPSAPVSGSASLFFTTNAIAQTENSSGAIAGTQVAPATGATGNQWVSYIDNTGTVHTSQPAFSNISGSVAAGQLPNPSASTLGGIESLASVSHKWINTISTAGVPSATQPASTDLSDSANLATNAQSFTAGAFTYDFSGAAHTLPVLKGLAASKPGTCTQGEVYFATDATAGQNLYYCTATNTWTQQSSGGGSGTVTHTAGALTAGQIVTGNGSADITVGNLSGDVTTSGSTATTVAKVNGTSVPTNSAADQAIVTTAAATGSWTSLPSCLDSGGNHLNYNTSTHAFTCGTSGGTVGSVSFSAITGSTNTGAAMLVGTGASLGPTGSGTVTANAFSGTLSAGNLPNPSASTLGGIESLASTSHQWINAISTSGVPTTTQPTFADVAAGTSAVAETVGTGGSISASGTGTITATNFTDFPDKKYIPAANCNNATAGAGWSLPTSSAPTAACHTGTNVQDGYLQFADGQSAQFSLLLPDDWDSASSLDIRVFFTDSSTSGTVILQAATSCTATNGSQADDQAFNTAQSFGTVTLSTPASAGWVATLSGLTKTGCSAGSFLHVKVSRTTDTAAGAANVSGAQLTERRTF